MYIFFLLRESCLASCFIIKEISTTLAFFLSSTVLIKVKFQLSHNNQVISSLESYEH